MMGRNVVVTVYLENIAKIGYKEKTLPTVSDGATVGLASADAELV